MNVSDSFEFDLLESGLAEAGACSEASDSHGMLCGLICAAGSAEPATWEPALLGGQVIPGAALDRSRRLLGELYHRTQVQLHSDDLEFSLLLPDDIEPLNLRTERLGQWCQGFLAGLGLGGLSDTGGLPDDIEELLHDFAEISHAEFDMENAGEEDEAAFAEITEYVRMGVLVILGALQPAGVSTPLH
jgi:yecA family protein